jgi:DNA primase
MVVIVEGAADVWRVGPKAVGIMGSDLSEQQAGMIRQAWANKPVAVFLDKDAADKSREIANKLFPYFGKKVFAVITEHKDPGSMTNEEIWQVISNELSLRGLELARV